MNTALGIGSTRGGSTTAPGMDIIEFTGHRGGLQLRELRQIAAPHAGVPNRLYPVVAALEPSSNADHNESDDQTDHQDNAGYDGGEYYIPTSQKARWLLIYLTIFLWYHQALDITLQQLTATEAAKRNNSKELVAVANNMHSIENALAVCCDDFQRLMLVYNKFLHSQLNLEGELPKPKQELDNEFPESILRVEFSENVNAPQQKDDFYAYMYDENEEQQFEAEQNAPFPSPEKELLNFEKRITKGRFKPVLKQLKDRIDPIRQVMLEKEREVLASKGIDVDELFGKMENMEQQQEDNRMADTKASPPCDSSSNSDSDSADEEAFKRRSKQHKERDNFAEMRQFLAQKQAINLFNLPPPPVAAAEEELLESEC